jgi:hypothetical protein
LIALDELLVSLAGDLSPDVGSVVDGVRVHVTTMDLDLPMEVRIAEGGRLLATLPRNRLATGFDLPAARMSLRLRSES